jgi:hypothetical protein
MSTDPTKIAKPKRNEWVYSAKIGKKWEKHI